TAWIDTNAGWEATATDASVATRELEDPIDLTEAASARLTFSSWLSAAAGSHGAVQISTDGGATWTTLDVVSPSDRWSRVDLSLAPFSGEVVNLRFVFDAAAPVEGFPPDSWGVSDLAVDVGIAPVRR